MPPLPAGWALVNITCSGGASILIGSNSVFDPGDTGVTINLGHSEDVVCIFTNARVSSLLWGDVHCDGFVNSIDALRILRFVAPLSLTPIAGCPDAGADVQIS